MVRRIAPRQWRFPCRGARDSDGALKVHDRMSGADFMIKPKLVLNISGPWADEVQKGLRFNRKMVGGTKGSHIVVRNVDLATALDGRMLYFETDDFRACLIYPMGEDRLFIGATDIRTEDLRTVAVQMRKLIICLMR